MDLPGPIYGHMDPNMARYGLIWTIWTLIWPDMASLALYLASGPYMYLQDPVSRVPGTSRTLYLGYLAPPGTSWRTLYGPWYLLEGPIWTLVPPGPCIWYLQDPVFRYLLVP